MSQRINNQAVAKTADLARLYKDLDNNSIKNIQKELNGVLEYMDHLNTAPISPNQIDNFRFTDINNLREDIVNRDQISYQRIRQNIINNFPNKNGNLLVLPGIFEE